MIIQRGNSYYLPIMDLLNKINKGTYTKESGILFKDFANEWLPTYIARKAPKPGRLL